MTLAGRHCWDTSHSHDDELRRGC